MNKDLNELIVFLQNVEDMFSGFVDAQILQLLSTGINLEAEYDKAILQRLTEQFESLSRIPFICSGKLFKQFFEYDMTATSAAPSEEGSFDKMIMAQESAANKSANPFAATDRRLTESVPPKSTRMTLTRDQP